MEACVGVVDTPYFATTDQTGAFEISGVPAGPYTLETWSERLSPQEQSVTVEAGLATTVALTLSR